MSIQPEPTDYPETLLTGGSFLTLMLALSCGMLTAIVLLPAWVPHLSTSLLGPNPKAYWYLSRGSGFVALTLLWLSMVLGLLISNKLGRFWPGVAASFGIHEYASLLGLAFALFHVIVLLGDRFINYTPVQLLLPFAISFQPFWVGAGQLGFYLFLIVTFSFYVRKWIGQPAWRLIHCASFLNYLMALVHGLAAGTDTSLPWAQSYYWITGGSLLFLFVYRIVSSQTRVFIQSPLRSTQITKKVS